MNKLIPIITAVIAFPGAAAAQSSWVDYGAAAMQGAVFNTVVEGHMDAVREDRSTTPSPRSGPRGGVRDVGLPAKSLVTGYRPSRAVTERAEAEYADWLGREIGPAAAAEFSRLAASTDLLDLWRRTVAADGLRSGDMADAFASYWIANWQMANNVLTTPPASSRPVVGQVRTLMASRPFFASWTEAQRQLFSETLMLNTVMQLGAYSSAARSGDEALKQRLGAAAAARFRDEMKVDLRGLRLTDAGFRKTS